jgi:hypothetical protein
VTHNFASKWQEHQFKSILGAVPSSSIISCVDFLDNYTMHVQNEIQSMNWHNVQINIFIQSTYKLDPADVLLGNNTLKVIKKLHYYVSNDTYHDTLLLQHSCYIGNFFKTKYVHQLSTLSGVMVAMGNSKVAKLGIFFHVA